MNLDRDIDRALFDRALFDCGFVARGVVALREEEQEKYGGHCILLIGQDDDRFWPLVQNSPYAQLENPMDAYAKENISTIADQFGVSALFPFEKTAQVYAPFFDWAVRSGEAFQSPVGMLLHHQTGLMISYRGALVLPWSKDKETLEIAHPCDACADKPCKSACPVFALGPQGYDTHACRGALGGDDPGRCMVQGCAARRACPKGPQKIPLHMPHVMRCFVAG